MSFIIYVVRTEFSSCLLSRCLMSWKLHFEFPKKCCLSWIFLVRNYEWKLKLSENIQKSSIKIAVKIPKNTEKIPVYDVKKSFPEVLSKTSIKLFRPKNFQYRFFTEVHENSVKSCTWSRSTKLERNFQIDWLYSSAIRIRELFSRNMLFRIPTEISSCFPTQHRPRGENLLSRSCFHLPICCFSPSQSHPIITSATNFVFFRFRPLENSCRIKARTTDEHKQANLGNFFNLMRKL